MNEKLFSRLLVLASGVALVLSAGALGDDQCGIPDESKTDCEPQNSSEDSCKSQGCCWVPSTPGSSTPWCFYPKDYTTPEPSEHCGIAQPDRKDCFPGGGSTQAGCEDRGCCWVPAGSDDVEEEDGTLGDTPWCFFPDDYTTTTPPPPPPGCQVETGLRLDCLPEAFNQQVDENMCLKRGCCWQVVPSQGGDLAIPSCYYSQSYEQDGYQMGALNSMNDSHMSIDASRTSPSWMEGDVMQIRTEVFYETADRLRIKIHDPSNQDRYEVPQRFVERPVDGQLFTSEKPNYKVNLNQNSSYGLSVEREDGTEIMKSIADNFIFADQFLQLSFAESGNSLYGLGEHRTSLMYDLRKGKRVSMWARDKPVNEYCNEYGTHPFYVLFEDSTDNPSRAHGVVFMNSNAMDVTLQPETVTWRSIGGILDFYVLIGPTPNDVINQYFNLIGKPMLPPYWSFGFQLCKYGYDSSENTWDVVKRQRAIGFPHEVQWNDIDYMDKHQDFTYDKSAYGSLPDMVKDIHDHKQKYVMILDPGIFDKDSNDALQQGNSMQVWINSSDGSGPLEGSVWPGTTFFPDFTNSRADEFWGGQLKNYHDEIPYDGVWIDMNEPSNFVTGSTKGCTGNQYDNPPFTPSVCDGLQVQTICPSAVQEYGLHYDLHNMYGHTEGIATNHGLKTVMPGKRPFIISRSTFMSSGRYMGHWTGDNNADWDSFKWSIASTVNTNIYGISMAGADVCGFLSDTNEELCVRWMQMGAFYTFFRNHNNINQKDQDPAVWSPAAQQTMKKYTLLRYKYLPYLYTQMFKASTEGQVVLGPVSFTFPQDAKTKALDEQFMWGDSVMVAPVLKQGSTSVNVYFPDNSTTWYELEDMSKWQAGGQSSSISAPLSKMPVFARSGSILVSQSPAQYLDDARKNAFTVECLVDSDGARNSTGYFMWDDGETDLEKENYVYSRLTCVPDADGNKYTLVNRVQHSPSDDSAVTVPLVKTVRVVTTSGIHEWQGANLSLTKNFSVDITSLPDHSNNNQDML